MINAVTFTRPPLVEGWGQSGQERRKERSKEKGRRRAEISRGREEQRLERGGETGSGYVTKFPWKWFFVVSLFFFVFLNIYWLFNLFFVVGVSVIFLLLFSLECWLLLLLLFCYALLCFCWFWVWACLVFCFVCFFSFLFFYLHGFSFFFCKFNCSRRFFSSSGRVPTGGRLHCASVSRTGIEGPVNYAVDDVGRQEACETSFAECCTLKKTVNDGVGRTMPGRGRCLVAPHSGWSWRADLWGSINCFFNIYMYPFENPWRLLAWCWNGEKCS